MARKGIKCTRIRVKAFTKTVCRSVKTGKLVKGGAKMVCPKTWSGKGGRNLKVHKAKNGACYVITKGGGRRFVKKHAKS